MSPSSVFRNVFPIAGSTPASGAKQILNTSKMDTTITETAIDKLRQMEVGDTLQFPAERSPYLRNLVSQRLIAERIEGKKWSVNLDMQQGVTIVTRTA